jgi:hypothetical protein
METVTAAASAAEMVAEFVALVEGPNMLPLLRNLQRIHQKALQVLDAMHLAYVEQSWEADWQAQHDRHAAAVAEIDRVIAERFGA